MKRLAVLGQPVAHSRSPAMQNAALAAVGLGDDWSYEAIELAPDQFAAAVGRMPAQGFVGANVTIPHKRAALELADSASEVAGQIGAANTLSFDRGRIHADNTDAPGLIAALPAPALGARALVLGAGGAGRAAAWALREAGAEVTIWNRSAGRAAELGAELGVAALPAGADPNPEQAEILVNATSVGLEQGQDSSRLAPLGLKELHFGADQVDDRLVVVDLVYGPTETELVRVAKDRGAKTVDGLEILVRQGAASFEIWTGLEAPLAAMRRAVRSENS